MYPTHHALLYIGLDSFDIENFSEYKQSSHDIIVQRYTEFRINDARSLVALATQTPARNSQQCFVIVANSIAIEAQNALLKLLEEPPTVSSFVFVLPQNTLLPTLRSRFMVAIDKREDRDVSKEFEKFISGTVPARLVQVSTLIEKKDSASLASLREGLLCYLSISRQKLSVDKISRLHWLILQMQLRGASLKMLWEDVAFTLSIQKNEH